LSILPSLTSRKLVVTAASAPVGQAVRKPPRRVLITDNFPTFGYPTTPTDTSGLSCLACANDFRASRRVAEVLYTVKVYDQISGHSQLTCSPLVAALGSICGDNPTTLSGVPGTRSILFRIRISCFSRPSAPIICLSTTQEWVPSGS